MQVEIESEYGELQATPMTLVKRDEYGDAVERASEASRYGVMQIVISSAALAARWRALQARKQSQS